MWSLLTYAGLTTYEFTSVNWASRCGTAVCDNSSDGWISNLPASEVGAARTNPAGELMYAGVGVKTSTSGAGATSVKQFTNVRQLTFNFCQNSSKGRGVIYAQVGNGPVDSIVVNRPASSGAGIYNRDSVIRLAVPQSGNIRFWINCTENGIYLHSLAIRAEEGGTTPFTQATYQLVTSADQLRDSDQVIIGVPEAGRIMGYFDETVSQNNIHSIAGTFSADGSSVAPRDEAIYTLRKTILGNHPCFVFQDELRYEEAYLVASGGQTKNRLALWDHLTDADTYGDYGYWDISVAEDGAATIHNLGRSRSTYLQYNASNNPTLFSCYAQQGSQTAVKMYRRVEALGDVEAIFAPMLNFGTLLQETAEPLHVTRSLTVQANRLSEDIRLSVSSSVFSLSDTLIDRDGDNIRITCNASAPGRYSATLTLTSGDLVATASLIATVLSPVQVSEAVMLPDYSMAFINDLEVTKKFDNYIFVRDASGSMLLYDNGDGITGTRYGAGLASGDRLTRVVGRMQNYYGVPELAPTAAFSVKKATAQAVPEDVDRALDSADVCRFVRLTGVRISEDLKLSWHGQEITVVDAFRTGVTPLQDEDIAAIVMISWDELQLWLVSETPIVSALDNQPCVQPRKRLLDGILVIEHNGHLYSTDGRMIK